jgi:hypothetical protein
MLGNWVKRDRIDRGEREDLPATSGPGCGNSSVTTQGCGWSVICSNEPWPCGSKRHRHREPQPLRRCPDGRLHSANGSLSPSSGNSSTPPSAGYHPPRPHNPGFLLPRGGPHRLRGTCPKPLAVSGGQRNASASTSEGVLKPSVCRGRPLSSAAIASSAAWSNRRRSPLRGRYWRSRPLDAPYLWRDPRSIGDVLVGAAPWLMAGHGELSRGQDGAPAVRRGRTVLTPARSAAGSGNEGQRSGCWRHLAAAAVG